MMATLFLIIFLFLARREAAGGDHDRACRRRQPAALPARPRGPTLHSPPGMGFNAVEMPLEPYLKVLANLLIKSNGTRKALNRPPAAAALGGDRGPCDEGQAEQGGLGGCPGSQQQGGWRPLRQLLGEQPRRWRHGKWPQVATSYKKSSVFSPCIFASVRQYPDIPN